MTSWITVPLRRKDEKEVERPYYFQVGSDEFSTQFAGYLYAHMYARSNSRKLFVNDQTNAISANYMLLREPFRVPSETEFTDSIVPSSTNLSGRPNRILSFLSNLKPEQLREAANEVFQWTDGMKKQLETLFSDGGLPTKYDIGINFSQGTVQAYVDAAKAAVIRLGLEEPTVFIAAPAIQTADFRKRAPESWKVYSIPETQPTSRLQARVRQTEYIRFLAELYALQGADSTFMPLSTPVGRFLFLTAKNPVSIDTQRFTFF
jgi:hypothetical protein